MKVWISYDKTKNYRRLCDIVEGCFFSTPEKAFEIESVFRGNEENMVLEYIEI